MAIITLSRILAFWAAKQPDRPAIDHEGAQISCYWQAHRKMISQLLRSERMSLYVDPRIARIPLTVCANGYLEAKVDEILVPRHSDL